MRRTLIVCILALGLLAAPLALAAGGASNPSGKGRSDDRAAHAGERANRTDDDNESRGKPAWVSTFQAQLRALRESWLDNSTRVREECRAAERPDENATKEDRLSYAHCIRDGYKAWLDVLRAERKEARAEMHAARRA